MSGAGGDSMGVNEIHDGRDSLLTQRLENLKRIERREGEAGGGSREFQQVFEFASDSDSRENREESKSAEKKSEAPMPPAPPRAITQEEIEKVKKRNVLKPGQIIDIEV